MFPKPGKGLGQARLKALFSAFLKKNAFFLIILHLVLDGSFESGHNFIFQSGVVSSVGRAADF
ncbi:protein of unknown function [Alcaligenes faecalis subsp. faecalis]|nr:protein of unknown function [Alcaligenes faecalis subsp. faecalis]